MTLSKAIAVAKNVLSKIIAWFSCNKFGIFITRLVFMFTLVIGSLTLFIDYLTEPVPTQIQAELIVDHVTFHVDKSTELKKSIKFHSATITEFDSIQFTPNDLPLIHITSFDEISSSFAMDTATPSTTHFGELHELKIAKGAKVKFSVDADKILNITIDNADTPPTASLQHTGAFHVTTQDCQIAGMELQENNFLENHFTITRLSEYETPSVEITGQTNILNLILSLADDQNVEILMGSQLPHHTESQFIVPKGISIEKIDLSKKDIVRGQPVVETAVKKGEIRYPAYPSIEPMRFGKSNFVDFGPMQNFRIDNIVFEPRENAFKLSLSGFAIESVKTYPQGFRENVQEYRLTYSDIVKVDKFYKLLVEMLLWIIPLIIGVVGIMSIMVKLSDDDITKLADKVKLSDDDITKLAKKLNKQTGLRN